MDDLADACFFIMNLPDEVFRSLINDHRFPLVNIGCGEDQTVRQLADLVANVVGFNGQMEWDTSKPDGTSQKLLDVSRLTDLGWEPKISLKDGIHLEYQNYLGASK